MPIISEFFCALGVSCHGETLSGLWGKCEGKNFGIYKMLLPGLLTKQREKLPVSRGSPYSPSKPAIQTKLPLSAPKTHRWHQSCTTSHDNISAWKQNGDVPQQHCHSLKTNTSFWHVLFPTDSWKVKVSSWCLSVNWAYYASASGCKGKTERRKGRQKERRGSCLCGADERHSLSN